VSLVRSSHSGLPNHGPILRYYTWIKSVETVVPPSRRGVDLEYGNDKAMKSDVWRASEKEGV
jgi:hypothetical protein